MELTDSRACRILAAGGVFAFLVFTLALGFPRNKVQAPPQIPAQGEADRYLHGSGHPPRQHRSIDLPLEQAGGTSGAFERVESEDWENILEREDDEDVDTLAVEFITVEDGGELELEDNEINIPEYALSQDTLMVLYIPPSGIIEYWIYPPQIAFNESVEVVLSYEHADLSGIEEADISIVRWMEEFQGWESVGGTVDTVHNVVSVFVTEFAPPPDGGDHAIYALADHN